MTHINTKTVGIGAQNPIAFDVFGTISYSHLKLKKLFIHHG